MVTRRHVEIGSGSGSGAGSHGGPALSEDRVKDIIREEVVAIVWGQILEMFRSINTVMMEFFDDHYATISKMVDITACTVVAAAGVGIGWVFQYQDFNDTKPSNFNEFQDPIIAMRWLSDVEGYFFTCSCPAH